MPAPSLAAFSRNAGTKFAQRTIGESAISLVAEFRPDLFNIDICLPDMNGYDLMRRLKQLDAMGNAKFFGVSGFGEDPRETASDFDSFMEKPLDIQSLSSCWVR